MKHQYQKGKSVLKAHIRSEFESQTIKKASENQSFQRLFSWKWNISISRVIYIDYYRIIWINAMKFALQVKRLSIYY